MTTLQFRAIVLFALIFSLAGMDGQEGAAQTHSRKAKHKSTGRSAGRRRRDELAARLHSLHGKIHGVRATIHSKKVQEKRISETISVVESRIADTRKHLDHVNTQLEILDSEHEKTVERLDDTQIRLAREKRILGQRILANYQRRNATYVQTLLKVGSIHELLSRTYLVRLVVQSDAELIAGIRNDVNQIAQDKRKIERQEQKQAGLASELETEKKRYAQDAARRRSILHVVKAARVEAEQELDDLESESVAMTSRIRALSAMLKRQEEAERQAAKAAARDAKRHGRRAHPAPAASLSHPVWHGHFIRPCSGPLTSGFGVRFHPILHRYRLHAGVDFGSPVGAPIRAAAAGVVLLSAYNRGYGNCVIIYHGSGMTTLYGHCSARLVREGQTVRQGQEIGRVGATGLATGPHLHFEVRHNGVPIAPY